MDNPLIELPLEHQLILRQFTFEVERMDEARTKELLVHLHAHMMLRENTYKSILAK